MAIGMRIARWLKFREKRNLFATAGNKLVGAGSEAIRDRIKKSLGIWRLEPGAFPSEKTTRKLDDESGLQHATHAHVIIS